MPRVKLMPKTFGIEGTIWDLKIVDAWNNQIRVYLITNDYTGEDDGVEVIGTPPRIQASLKASEMRCPFQGILTDIDLFIEDPYDREKDNFSILIQGRSKWMQVKRYQLKALLMSEVTTLADTIQKKEEQETDYTTTPADKVKKWVMN